jgi:hypothetical protein
MSTDLRNKILDKVPDDSSKTMGLKKLSAWWFIEDNGTKKMLQVGVGVQYEMCVNINVKDGMTNGSPCIVQMSRVWYRHWHFQQKPKCPYGGNCSG